MRYALFGLMLAASLAVGADSKEPPAVSEEEADAEIREIEKGVSGADKVEEFVPEKPLSADKAIALPSDI